MNAKNVSSLQTSPVPSWERLPSVALDEPISYSHHKYLSLRDTVSPSSGMKQIEHSGAGLGNLRTDCQLCWVGWTFFFFFLTSLYQVCFLGYIRLEQCRLWKAQSKLTLAMFQKCWELANLNHFQLQILFSFYLWLYVIVYELKLWKNMLLLILPLLGP